MMNAPVVIAIISAAASLLASALTFSLTKKKEREAEWRKQKLDHYKEFMAALNGLVGRASEETRTKLANAANNVFLVAGPPVLVALRAYLDETATSNKHPSLEEHDRLLTQLLFAVRDDLGIQPNKPPTEYRFRLWSASPPPKQ